MAQTKDGLRNEILQKRDSLSADERDTKSTIISIQLLSSEEFKRSSKIFTYASYGSEVSTSYLIQKALLLGKEICVPRVNFKDSSMHPVKISSLESLKPNKVGIPEPGFFSSKINPMKIDVVLVPAAVFDLHGHRIGSGKGFYDRYLSAYKNHAAIIGVAYDFQVVEDIPEEPHDVKVHKIITEKRIINCHEQKT